MRKIITAIKEIEVSIPDEKIESYLRNFRESTIPNGDIEDMFNHIAWVYNFENDTFIDGIGKVQIKYTN